ncbi:PAS domain-containing protein [Stenotrophomonas sp. CFBP 13718]|uniref:hybrid sensor histidine kinase/response regulator n=1 Tax=Stenotrophomonas sp. CFBP 13718 TaxID=2775304 RepID=UPI0017807293|nr:PAS domain-containing protein [Stenotrophomonas sp. CFBP 13718]MBD8694563.1 PAS domain-containing protein [Stenotrophomonas sp. CFBP 13718]
MTEPRRDAPIRILMLEDSALDAELITAQLSRARLNFTVQRVWTRAAFLAELDDQRYDIILADHVLPGFDGDSALQLTQELMPRIPFIFVSGTLTEELAVQALTRGARDYVVKQRLQRLPDAIIRAIDEGHARFKLLNAEHELKQSRDRLQLITDSMPALIAHLDPDHRYQFANTAYEAWHGRPPAELIGLQVKEVVGSALFDAALPHLQRVLEGQRVRFELEVPRVDGTPRHVLLDGVPEISADGHVAGYYTLGRDISDLKQAELLLRDANESLEQQVQQRTADLQQSESRLQALFESSFQLQNLLDTDGRVVDANRASLAAILSSKDAVSGELFCDSAWFAASPGAGDVVCAAVVAAASGNESRHELDLQLPTGRRSFDFSFRPLLDHQGRITAVVSEAVETTARRQAEEALRQSQKIEAVGQLTGGIAHDFNNILTVIAGNVEHAKLLVDRQAEASSPVARPLDNALKGVMRAASLTQRLLAFARRQPLMNQAVNLNEQVLGMQDMLQRALGELVRLQIDVAPDMWCVEVDPSQLEASILNLAVNARDAMPDGGTLVLETGTGVLDDDFVEQNPDVPPGQYAVLRVRDSGHGMGPETMARVFEPFFTTKEVGRGTGLGLSMVYGFVKQSGGHVQLESVPGEGTVITLLFPRSSLPLPGPRPAEDSGYAEYESQDETILVAEDNDDVRAYTVDALRQLGYRVLEAHDGPSAIRLLERPDVEIDLLFSDIVMPGMTGWELARESRERKPELRILFTSGYPRDHQANNQLGRPIAILPKPFTRIDLARAVRGNLDEHASR